KVDLFYKLRHVMNELFDLRRQLLSGHLTQDQIRDVKRHITVRLDWGNEHLGLDLVPRKEFEMADAEQISVSDLYKMHLSSRHSVQQSTSQGDSMRQRHGEACRIPIPHHLFLNLKSFTYNTIGEDTDVFFSLFDMREGKQISERFMVKLNKNGGPKNPEKIDRLCALFTDLSNRDMKRDLYIVSHVIRTGRMLLNDSKKGPAHVQYRRPYGCAVLSMSDILQSISELKEEKDFVLKVYTCNNENEWCQIHENIIRKSSTKYTAPSTNYGLIISLQLLRGEMELIRRENPMIFNRGVAVTRKLGFPDVIMPGDIRNDLYLILERGDFERGGKSVQKNIEVTVYVLYADGEILKDCISLGSGEPSVSEHRSFVLYHNNSPRWGEIIKLPIPVDRFRGSHLRFEFRHCSTKDKGEKKLFGFAFTPLMREDGTTLSDESHELYVYKCDENSTFSNQALYLGLPCCKEDFNGCPNIPSSLIFQRSAKEMLWISTQLSSTKLTQNVDLLALLKWKAHPDRLMDILGRLRHVSGEEIVKFLQDILDTLFSILDDNTDKYGPLVFQSLVFIINLLRDSKYYHFRPVMDTYIQKHFAGALAYKELIHCLKWYMDRSAEVIRQDHIQEAMRALEYLFKFIVQSRILYSRATCGMEEDQFRLSIQELFQSIRFVLSLDSRSSETLIFTQFLQDILDTLFSILDDNTDKYGPLVFQSLVFIINLLRDSKYYHFRPVMDTYIQKHFAGALAYKELIHCLKWYMDRSAEVIRQDHIQEAMRALEYLFKFIVQSRILYSRATCGMEEDQFRLSIQELFQSIRFVLSLDSRSSETLIFTQGPQPPHGQAIGAVNCVQPWSGNAPRPSPLSAALLNSFPTIFDELLQMFTVQEVAEFVRGTLGSMPSTVHIGQSMDVVKLQSIARTVDSRLFSFPGQNRFQETSVQEEVEMMVESLLDVLLQTLLTIMSKSQSQEAMSEIHYQHLLDNFQSKEELKIFCVFRNLMKLSIFPRDWMVMRLLTSKYGDMRVMMAYELFGMWENLGENKIHFIPGMIGPFLGVTLVPQNEVRNIMIPIFHDMMDWSAGENRTRNLAGNRHLFCYLGNEAHGASP
ncbi:UNVERIFIED_CONTAM: hypothetical protein FKN15_051224, partial [Acipenser sinensis]